jgi:WD40 repeat protein
MLHHQGAICSISWSYDGQQLAAGTADGTIVVWSASTGGVLVSYVHEGPVATVAFSPTAQQLASVSASELALWSCDAQTVFKDTVSDHWPLWRSTDTEVLRAMCYRV